MRALLVALSCAVALFAQADTGVVSGIVTDSSGAVAPGVTVKVTRVEINSTVELLTNDSGFYSAPALRPGRYEITVAKAGFHSQKSQPFDVRVQDRVEVTFQLDLAAAKENIVVEAATPLLESETSSLGHVVEEKTVTELPLNGRNFIQLAILGAGTLQSRTIERDNFISNGARALQNSYLLDGVDNRNWIMGNTGSAQIVQPIIDTIQEFKVQTATFSAEFGQSAGGVVNVTTKSGTNSLHVNVFEFLRNSRTDATPFFEPAGQPKPLHIQNQFGATLGGPVIRNRTFFFAGWQSSREVIAAPQIASVPTLAMRQGIFSQPVRDPKTLGDFPSNTIPMERWDPVATGLVQVYPRPNLPGEANNFFYNPKERLSGDSYDARIDHRLSAKDFLFARASWNTGHNELPTRLPEPANGQGYVNLRGRSLMLSATRTISSSMLNELRFGAAYTDIQEDLYGERLFDRYGIKGAVDLPNVKGLPTFDITGMANLGTSPASVAPIPAAGSANYPNEKSGEIYQILENFSWIHGRHTIKLGVDLKRITMFAYATNLARPRFVFNGTYTKVPFADFLLGYVQNAGTSQQHIATLRQGVYHGYIQDDWRAAKKLTFNIGVRYELTTPFTEANNRQSNFALDAGACYFQIVTAEDPARCGVGRALVRTDFNNLAPRLGIAYQASSKTIVRSGFGVFYGRDENAGIVSRLPNNPPFVTTATFVGDQSTPAFFLQNGIPAGSQSTSNLISFPFDLPLPYVVQWNLNVQRQLGAGFVAQLGYTGSEAHRLVGGNNLNQPYPGTGDPNARRPYPSFSTITVRAPRINSNYHALLSQLERRFSNGFNLLASYTYGHSIDGGSGGGDQNDTGAQDARNFAGERGSSNFDVKHRFVLSGVYVLPFGKKPGIQGALVRDWQVSGIYSHQTGQPFTVTLNNNPAGTGNTTTPRPDRLRDGSLPDDQRSVHRWFDTSAFAAPSCPCFGNSGRNILRGPGLFNVDLGVARDFRFSERMRLQFRSEAFNLFNHPNLGLPAAVIGSPNAGTIVDVTSPERQIQFALKLYF